MKNLLRYFVQGLLIIVPIGISVYILAFIFLKIGSLFTYFGVTVNPYVDPIIGAAAVLGFILLTGMLGTTILVRPLLLVLDKVADKTPLFKTLYSSLKDLMSAFVGNKKKFSQPVLVTVNKENNIQKLGFITQTDLHELGVKDGKVAIYIPNSYAFSGTMIIVPNENVQKIDAPASETMKFIVSGGISHID